VDIAAGGTVEPDAPVNGASHPEVGAPTGAAARPPGIREQVGATLDAGKRLVRAHIALARAEASEIVDEVKRMVGFVLLALALLFMVVLLLTLGLPLFLGEWLFGSLGWGVLLGTFLLLDLAVVAVLVALGTSGGRLGFSFGLAAVIGIAVGLVLGLDLAHRGWTSLGETIAPNLEAATRPLVVAVVGLAVIGGILGLVGGLRGGGRGAGFGGLVVGAILGALIGVVSSTTIAPTVGAALGVWVGLIAWPILAGRSVMRTGIDIEALKQRFTPDQTIELTKETIEWARARTPLAPKS
jgi:hypothetical protein